MAKNKISEFSSTPANNTDIGGINIAEGCAPSGINNAIRQLMADLKDFQTGAVGDDLTVGGNAYVTGNAAVTGNLTVTGTTTLTGIPTAPTAAAGTNTTQIATTAYAKNAVDTAAATLAPLASPAFTGTPTAPTASAGTSTTQLATTAFVMANGVPTGAVIPFANSTAPTGWLECDGSAVSRTTYAALYAAIGTTYGSGNGSTTFNIPDLRGEFVRGWDHGRGVDASRTLGSAQDGTGVPDKVTFSGTWPLSNSVTNGDGTVSTFSDASSGGGGISGYGGNGSWTTSRIRTRPRNVAMMFCIKV